MWTPEEDALLAQVVIEDGNRRWKYIAMKMSQKNKKQIIYSPKVVRNRWENHVDPDLNKGPWSAEEDIQLLELINTIGKKWSEISRHLPGRTMHTVKNRYKSLTKQGYTEPKLYNNAVKAAPEEQKLMEVVDEI